MGGFTVIEDCTRCFRAQPWVKERHGYSQARQGTGRANRGKTVDISVVYNDDATYENDASVKYFLFKRNTRSGIKTDKFNVTQVLDRHGDWLRLRLSGYAWVMYDRWVKVNKSLDFLNFLLRESYEKLGTIKASDELAEDASRSLIRRAILKCSPICPNCNGRCMPDQSWLDFLGVLQDSACTVCSGTGHAPSQTACGNVEPWYAALKFW